MGRLAIVCGSPSSEMDAPWSSPDYEIWVLGNRLDRYPRYDRIFEIHDNLSQHDASYAQWLVDHEVPMVVGELFPIDRPWITTFPYESISNIIDGDYLTSSSACMLALALYEGHHHIELYGVDMAVDDHEYFWQRPCMEFWVGFAKGCGCQIFIPDQSPLCKSDYCEGRDYGFVRPETPIPENEYSRLAEQHKEKIKASAQRLSELEDTQKEIEGLKLSITAHDAARQVYDRMAKVERAKQSKQKIRSLTDTVDIR